MKFNSFSYYAIADREKSLGVAKKVNNTVSAAKNIGLSTRLKIFDKNFKGVFCFIYSLVVERSDVIMLRFSHSTAPILFFILLAKRFLGTKIVIDIPTPRATVLKENKGNITRPIIRYIKNIYSYLSGSWVLLPANIIIQYADEGAWFEFGVKKKTYKVGNGIIIDDQLPLVQSVWPAKELKLIGVAQLANWHGYDRLIKALAETNKIDLPYKISFTIVGDGTERPALEALVKELNLHEQVFFTGMLIGEELNQIFLDKHIGVASLGLYRIGLNEASVLKTREYIARGLPVIGVGHDPDFEINSPYRFLVSNDDCLDDILYLLGCFCEKSIPESIKLRGFAINNLSLEKKLEKILQRI